MPNDNNPAKLFANAALLDALPFAALATDTAGVVLTWNLAAETLYGWTRDEAIGRTIHELTVGEGLRQHADEIMALTTSGRAWSGDFPVMTKQGVSILARVTLFPLLDDGQVVGVLGVSEDVSDLRFHQAQAAEDSDRLRLALDASGLGAWEWDVGTGRVHWDERMEEICGFARGTFSGTYDAWHATIHPDDREQVLSSVQQALALKSRNRVEHRVVRPTGEVRWIESHSQPVLGPDGSVRGTIGCVRDITDWKHAELERHRLRAQERFLFEVSERLSESLQVEQTLTIVADVAVPSVADWCIIHLRDERDPRLALLRHRHVRGERLLTQVTERWPATFDSEDGVGATMRDGQPRFFPVITDEMFDAAIANGDERAAVLRELGLRSVIVVPLQARGRIIGAVTFGRERSDPFDVEQQGMLTQLAARAALAIDNALTFEREHRAALTLQHSLLPEIALQVPGLTIATRYIAGSAGAQVGGDWYDAIALPDGRIGITVGDVMGHGLASAALMGQVRAALRGVAATGGAPGDVLATLDSVVGTLSTTQLVTCVYGILDPRTSELTFSSAGHPPPLLVRPGGASADYLDVDPGVPLGVSAADGTFPCTTITLERGATLVLFTDGLIESRERSLQAGLDALRALAPNVDENLERLSDRLIAGMHAGVTADDDTALLVVRVD